MSENTNQLSVEQQLLVSAAADEILESTNIHQQTLVRMLAVASEHNLNAANLPVSYTHLTLPTILLV